MAGGGLSGRAWFLKASIGHHEVVGALLIQAKDPVIWKAKESAGTRTHVPEKEKVWASLFVSVFMDQGWNF